MMQLYVDGEQFAAALAHAGRVQSGNQQLRQVLLTARSEELDITATDITSELVQTIPATVGVQGQSAVDVPFAQKFCAKLPKNRKVEISLLEDKKTSIKCLVRGDNYATATIHAGIDEYPEFTTTERVEMESMTTTAGQLVSMIKHCVDATDENSPRTYLQGVNYSLQGKWLRMFASDGYRLAECKSPVDDASKCEPAIVPVRVNKTLLALLAKMGPESPVVVELSSDCSRFTIGNTTVLSCINIKAEFPGSVDKLIPDDSTIEFVANNQALVTSIKRMQPVFTSTDGAVTLVLSRDNVDVTAESEMGSISDPVVATTNTDEYKSKFNSKHLLQSLSSFPPKHNVRFLFPNEPGATIIRDATENAPPFQHIVMPIRV